MIIKTKFNIGQRVRVVDPGIEAIVDQIYVNVTGVQYRIVYWVDGEHLSTDVYESELSAIEEAPNAAYMNASAKE